MEVVVVVVAGSVMVIVQGWYQWNGGSNGSSAGNADGWIIWVNGGSSGGSDGDNGDDRIVVDGSGDDVCDGVVVTMILVTNDDRGRE